MLSFFNSHKAFTGVTSPAQDRTDTLRPLKYDSHAYMEAHLNFRQHLTNQGELMLAYLQESLSQFITDAPELRPFRLASIGSGTGILDVPLVQELQTLAPINYLGIEPNSHQMDMAKAKMLDILTPTSSAQFSTSTMEAYVPNTKTSPFDAMIAVHVMYYSPDIRPMLAKAFDLLHPAHGRLLAMVAADNAQNRLFMETTEALHGFVPYLSNTYRDILDSMQITYDIDTIQAVIDITDFANNPTTPDSMMFLDFFLHMDASSLPPAELERYTRSICDAAEEHAGKLLLPHVVDAVTAHR